MSLCWDMKQVLPAWAAPMGTPASALGMRKNVPEEDWSRRLKSIRCPSGKWVWHHSGSVLGHPEGSLGNCDWCG